MDELLLALVEAAQQRRTTPRLRIATRTMLVTGSLAPASLFLDRAEEALQKDFVVFVRNEENLKPKKERRDASLVNADAHERTSVAMAALKDSEQGGAICLANADCWPVAGGDGIRLPAVRIPFASVDLWWVTGGQVLKAPTEGGSWFGAVSFPIPGT